MRIPFAIGLAFAVLSGSLGAAGCGSADGTSPATAASGSGGATTTGTGGAAATTGSGGAAGSGGSTGSGVGGSATSGQTGSATSSSGTGGATFTCAPEQKATTNAGGTCANLNQAYTARGINVGYYPFKVKKPTPMYSGDYGGAADAIFTPGGGKKGVILQMLPAGSYVGLSTTGPNYDPPTGCFPPACGDSSHAACKDDSPPMRPTLEGMAWGYGYTGGASHMQGWIPFDPEALEFAGYDAAHPCALGPAGVDFEADAACGMATSCAGKNPTCGATNRCNEGADDCAETACGAKAGGPLTPASWQRTVTKPSAHECAKSKPHPSVQCLANGGEADFFFVYPFGAYLYWGQNSTTKHWLHYGDKVQVYFHNRDAQNVMWDFVEVLDSGAPTLTPKSDGKGAPAACTSSNPENCVPCKNGGTCGWVQDVFLQ